MEVIPRVKQMGSRAQNQPTTPFFYGWIVAGSAFTVLMITYGVQYSFGVFVPRMVADLGWQRASLGAVFSLYGVVYMGFTMVTGRLTDRLGPRRVITIGGLLLGSGIALSAFVGAPWQLYLSYGVLAALGMSTAYIPCNMTVARWFIRRRGLAVGLSSCGASVGILIVPLIVLFAIENWGWRHAMLGSGVVLCGLSCLAAQFMRLDPSELNLEPDGDDPALIAKRTENADVQKSWTFAEAARTSAFWWFIASFALALLTMTIPFVHLAQFAADLGLAEIHGALCISVIGASALFGGIGLGALSDRLGPLRALQIGLVAQILAYLSFVLWAGVVGMYVGAVAFGLFYGSFVAIFPSLLAERFGRAHAGEIGGYIVGGGGLLGAWGPAAAGYFRDTQGNYALAFIAATAVAVIALLAFSALPKPVRGDPE